MNPVDQQLDAYNNRDLVTFLACYSDDIEVYMLESGQQLTDGKAQLSDSMKTSFESNPHAKTALVTRINQGNLIIDQEKITGYIEGKTITSIAIYEVQDDKITKLWFGGRSVE